MQDMTQQLMPSTPKYHAYLEGIYLTKSVLYFMYKTFTACITTLLCVEHLTVQTREYKCTCDVLPQVLARGIFAALWMQSDTLQC